jgi:hypothetical protein
MGLSVVTVASGGMPVVEAPSGTPVTEATNKYGLAVTKVVGKPGMPVTFETIGAAFTGTTWSASDKASNVVLSNGNLTVGANSITAGAVRSVASKVSGKWYFETTWTNPTGGAGSNGVGIATATAPLSGGGASLPGNGTGGCVVFVGGNVFFNGVVSGVNIGAVANGQTTCVAIDLVNSSIWFRINGGIWNNSGTANPASNIGGISILTLFPGNPAFAVVTTNGTVPSCVANFGMSAFTQAVPAGFTAGWPA